MNYWDSVGRWMNTLLVAIVGVIAFDTLFQLLEANDGNVIVRIVRALAVIFLVPFQGMFGDQDFVITALVAVLGYALAVGIALGVLRSMQATATRAEREPDDLPASADREVDVASDGRTTGRPSSPTRPADVRNDKPSTPTVGGAGTSRGAPGKSSGAAPAPPADGSGTADRSGTADGAGTSDGAGTADRSATTNPSGGRRAGATPSSVGDTSSRSGSTATGGNGAKPSGTRRRARPEGRRASRTASSSAEHTADNGARPPRARPGARRNRDSN